MADVDQAVEFVVRQEDATLSGTITHTADGKRTRFGIDEHFHSGLSQSLFYTSMGRDAALHVAEAILRKGYADPLCIAGISDQRMANLLLSLGVNCGVRTASRMLQNVLGVPGDGRIGPVTLDAIDKADPSKLLARLQARAVQHYEALIETNPKLAIYRDGWMRRVAAV